jgi:hypothetical protein
MVALVVGRPLTQVVVSAILHKTKQTQILSEITRMATPQQYSKTTRSAQTQQKPIELTHPSS